MKAQKPLSSAYPTTLKTIGDHLRKRRLDLELFQKDVAKMLGVGEPSIYNWENNLTKPAFKYSPKIIEFLGYVQFGTPSKSIGEKIVAYRKLRGLSQKQLARQLGIDPGTLSKWERNIRQTPERVIKKIKLYRENPPVLF